MAATLLIVRFGAAGPLNGPFSAVNRAAAVLLRTLRRERRDKCPPFLGNLKP
jgi:hypothetical protein